MIKRLVPLAIVVLVANGAALFMVARNVDGTPEARVQLTEREARLSDTEFDTTGVTLLLAWHDPAGPRRLAASWLTRENLESLGFDCSVAPDAPGAERHYSFAAQPTRSVYVVLDFNPAPTPVPSAGEPPTEAAPAAAGGEAVPGVAPRPAIERPSRLAAVDAGSDPMMLRQRYPDRTRFIVTHGVARLVFHAATPTARAFLGGTVAAVFPDELYVPTGLQAPLRRLERTKNSSLWEPLAHEPRYDVTIEYGSRLRPRVVDVRLR
ncbi:MAG: DUF4824 family protein [Bacteroidales bacterium]